jgi:hypothetical protein
MNSRIQNLHHRQVLLKWQFLYEKAILDLNAERVLVRNTHRVGRINLKFNPCLNPTVWVRHNQPHKIQWRIKYSQILLSIDNPLPVGDNLLDRFDLLPILRYEVQPEKFEPRK